MINYKSLRKFNKTRKRLPLGKDDSGKTIYPYDFVRVQIPHETRTSHCSRVQWNALDGAFIDSHPAHVKMELSRHRNLSNYIRKTYAQDTTCVKISWEEYETWEKEQEEKNK